MEEKTSKEQALLRALRISSRLSFIFLIFAVFSHITAGKLSLYFPAFLAFLTTFLIRKSMAKLNKKPQIPQITNAQIESLLRLDGGKISAERLAEVTGTEFSVAKAFLEKATVNGEFDVEVIDTTLFYTRRLL